MVQVVGRLGRVRKSWSTTRKMAVPKPRSVIRSPVGSYRPEGMIRLPSGCSPGSGVASAGLVAVSSVVGDCVTAVVAGPALVVEVLGLGLAVVVAPGAVVDDGGFVVGGAVVRVVGTGGMVWAQAPPAA